MKIIDNKDICYVDLSAAITKQACIDLRVALHYVNKGVLYAKDYNVGRYNTLYRTLECLNFLINNCYNITNIDGEYIIDSVRKGGHIIGLSQH